MHSLSHTDTNTSPPISFSSNLARSLWDIERTDGKSEGRDREDSGSQSGPVHTFKSKGKGESVCKRERLWLRCLTQFNIDTCTVSKRNHFLMLASCTGLRPAFPTLHLNTNTANLKTDLSLSAHTQPYSQQPQLVFLVSRPAQHHIFSVVLNELIMN